LRQDAAGWNACNDGTSKSRTSVHEREQFGKISKKDETFLVTETDMVIVQRVWREEFQKYLLSHERIEEGFERVVHLDKEIQKRHCQDNFRQSNR